MGLLWEAKCCKHTQIISAVSFTRSFPVHADLTSLQNMKQMGSIRMLQLSRAIWWGFSYSKPGKVITTLEQKR